MSTSRTFTLPLVTLTDEEVFDLAQRHVALLDGLSIGQARRVLEATDRLIGQTHIVSSRQLLDQIDEALAIEERQS